MIHQVSLISLALDFVRLNFLLFSGFWGWMNWVCQGLLWLLTVIHFVIPDWGLSIIFLALIVRIVLYPLSPFAGLKPLGIVLIQLPILIALFQVLGTAEALRDARFLWIGSLAQPDKLFSFGFNIPLLGSYFNLLPFLMSGFTLLSFKLAPAPTAEKKEQGMQNLFLVAMTLMFFFLFYSFPSGMVLYWTFANIFHIVQYQVMVRKREVC